MIVVWAVAIAALVGAVAGSFFEVRLRSLLWLAPVVVVLVGAGLFVAPVVRDSADAPLWARDAAAVFADPWSLAQIFAAGVIAAVVAALMLHMVRNQRTGAVWLPSMGFERAGRAPTGAVRSRSAPARLRDRMEAVQERSPSVLARERRVVEPAPVFEVAETAPVLRAPLPPPAPAPRPAPEPGSEKRVHPRRRTLLSGQVLADDGTSAACTIHNLSVTGARVRLAAPQILPPEVCLIDVSNGLAHDAVVQWSRGASLGLRFERSLDLKAPQDERAQALHRHWISLASR